MNRKLFKRFASAVLAAGLLGGVLIVPATTASTPAGWYLTVDDLAVNVGAGYTAGFRVTVGNTGPSNISSLYLTTTQTGAAAGIFPASYDSATGGACTLNSSVGLRCAFGAFPVGRTETFTVLYSIPSTATSWSIKFQLNTTGATLSDKGGNSRGDYLTVGPDPALVFHGASDLNFGGGLQTNGNSVSNSSALGVSNPQSTRLDNLPVPSEYSAYYPAFVQDGITTNLCSENCPTNQFGEWSKVSVSGGATLGTPFKVTMTIRGKSLPNPNPKVGDVQVVHVDDAGIGTIIGDTDNERCVNAATPPDATLSPAGCVIATYVGKDLQVVVWLFHNGGLKNFGS